MDKRMIIKIGGLLLCVFFFVAPLVQCSQDSSLSATGLQISTGTGNLMGNAEKSYPVVFVLLIMPVILVIIGFKNKPFMLLHNISIGGLAAQIIFMIGAYSMLNSGEYSGGFVLTMFNWLILAIYIGLIILIQHCIKEDPTPENTIERIFRERDAEKQKPAEKREEIVITICGVIGGIIGGIGIGGGFVGGIGGGFVGVIGGGFVGVIGGGMGGVIVGVIIIIGIGAAIKDL